MGDRKFIDYCGKPQIVLLQWTIMEVACTCLGNADGIISHPSDSLDMVVGMLELRIL